MHIPDGFLDVKTLVATSALSITGLGLALRHARRHLPRQQVPLLGMTAAFVFAAQMLNFPVAGGTSGHLMGGVLAAVLLGPSAAVIVMASVLILQCFLFADGGVLALGANLFNMALVGTVGGYAIYRGISKVFKGLQGQLLAVAFASWCSTVLAALCCAGQLAFSGAADGKVVFPAMGIVHLLIGMGEALITSLIVLAIVRARPDLIGEKPTEPSRGYGQFVALGLIVAVGLALFVAPFACPWPDGLEKVAGVLGFENQALKKPLWASPFPDYKLPWIRGEGMATALAGVVGTLVMFGLSFGWARLLAARSKEGS